MAQLRSGLALLKDLIRFPSLSREEAPIASYVESFVRSAGLPVRRVDDNVYFWLGEGAHRLLLNSHLDVVPPSSEHPYDPFEPVEDGPLLYGRGSVDAKASGASMTTALLELADERWTPPGGQVMVALTTCEETDHEHNGLRRLRPLLPKIHAALIGEPTNLQPVVAQKGLLILQAHARGRSAHAARAALGDNAILKAMRDLQRLDAYSFERSDPFLGMPSVTVTLIKGGAARNVVPDLCSFDLDIRTTPAYSHGEIINLMRDLLESDITVRSDRIVPLSTPMDTNIVEACLGALPGSTPIGSPTASDWLYLRDVPTVKIGPGSSERSHTPDEHVEIAEIGRAVRVYKDIIKEYFAHQA